MPNLVARFFKMMRTRKGDLYNASSYTTFLSCFTRYLADTFHPPLDVKSSPAFKIVRTMVKRMRANAQNTQGKKPGDNASKVVTARHLRQAWETGSMGRKTPDALASATYVVVTVGFGCRAINEVRCITNRSLVWGPLNPKTGVHTKVTLEEEWVCKNRTGGSPRVLEAQISADDDNPDTCMVRTLMEFQRRKSGVQLAPEAALFWNINEAARKNPEKCQKWFKNQAMGVHTIAKLFTNSLTRAGIDCKAERYTASSSRKVQLDGGLDNGVPEVLLGKLAGQRSHHAKDSYIHKKDTTHKAANIAVSRAAAGKAANYQEILMEVVVEDNTKVEEDNTKVEEDNTKAEEYNTKVEEDNTKAEEDSTKVEEDKDTSSEEGEDYTVSQGRIMSEFGSVELYQESRKKKSKKMKKGSKEKNRKLVQQLLKQQSKHQQQAMKQTLTPQTFQQQTLTPQTYQQQALTPQTFQQQTLAPQTFQQLGLLQQPSLLAQQYLPQPSFLAQQYLPQPSFLPQQLMQQPSFLPQQPLQQLSFLPQHFLQQPSYLAQQSPLQPHLLQQPSYLDQRSLQQSLRMAQQSLLDESSSDSD